MQHPEGTCLCIYGILLSEQCIEKFEENIEKFILDWENRESKFIEYFRPRILTLIKKVLNCVVFNSMTCMLNLQTLCTKLYPYQRNGHYAFGPGL